mmetsp:Transcript_10554/g.22335  ORF Transcript_10554/g.22335 Transcript_10554/m.22335 type:complete len:92 (-) Transcript_10554:981-1256(-)
MNTGCNTYLEFLSGIQGMLPKISPLPMRDEGSCSKIPMIYPPERENSLLDLNTCILYPPTPQINLIRKLLSHKPPPLALSQAQHEQEHGRP